MAYLALVLTAGPLLAPWVYRAVQWVSGFEEAFVWLASQPFNRYVNRCLLTVALVAIWPLSACIKVRSWADVGLVKPRGRGHELKWGLVVGLISLAIAAALALAADARDLRSGLSLGGYARTVVSATGTAVVVATIEELLFRGAIFGALRRAYGLAISMTVSSAVYAIVHFLQRSSAPDAVGWTTGFTVLGDMMRGFWNVEALIPGFLNLFVAGLILALLVQRTGSLYASIGLHAGWIFSLKSYGALTQEVPGATVWVWGSDRLIDGWAALLVLCLCLAAIARLWQPKGPSKTLNTDGFLTLP